jgi:Flp pilus assembly protein TadG
MKRNHGQGLIEFALILPIIILVLTVCVDLGRMIFYYASISNAVREGTRWAIVHNLSTEADLDAVVDIVKGYTSGIDPEVPRPSINGANITVSASYAFQPITPGLSLILRPSGEITLRAQSTSMIAPLYRP